MAVSVDGFPLPPFMGLTSWAAFIDGGKAEAMVMGDLVLFPDEVNPVLDVLLATAYRAWPAGSGKPWPRSRKPSIGI
jgi:hypothetical protein